MSTQTPTQPPGIPTPKYFTSLAATYARQTGNATHDIFFTSLPAITALAPITSTSSIHDNAAGPGTATSALLPYLSTLPNPPTPQILITDNNPAMVAAAREAFPSPNNNNITISLMDSLTLSIPSSTLTHSLLSFSLPTLSSPLLALQQIHRSLQPSGLAAILTWKRFGAAEVIHAAQRLVKGDAAELMPVPWGGFMREGVVRDLVVQAGFKEEGVMVEERGVVVKGEELEGLRGFLLGEFTRGARSGWSLEEEEEAGWEGAVDRVLEGERERFGGVRFEAWVVLARK